MVKKGAVFKERFNQVISRAVDMGVVEKWEMIDGSILRAERLKWSRHLEKDTYKANKSFAKGFDKETSSSNDKLKLKNLMGPFCLVILGVFVGFCLFVFETFTNMLLSVALLGNSLMGSF